MSKTVAEVNTPLNELKEARELAEFADAMHREHLVRKLGKTAAEAKLSQEEAERTNRLVHSG